MRPLVLHRGWHRCALLSTVAYREHAPAMKSGSTYFEIPIRYVIMQLETFTTLSIRARNCNLTVAANLNLTAETAITPHKMGVEG